jgi:hypothetical protein
MVMEVDGAEVSTTGWVGISAQPTARAAVIRSPEDRRRWETDMGCFLLVRSPRR